VEHAGHELTEDGRAGLERAHDGTDLLHVASAIEAQDRREIGGSHPLYQPSRAFQSIGLTPAARSRISSSPSPG
jgi:hypothetical protein